MGWLILDLINPITEFFIISFVPCLFPLYVSWRALWQLFKQVSFRASIYFLQVGIRADCYFQQSEFYFTNWYQSGFYFNKLVSERILFQQIDIRADGEHDGANVATTIDEDELWELEHPNESSSRFSRRMGGGRRRFWKMEGYHGLYGGAEQGTKKIMIKG